MHINWELAETFLAVLDCESFSGAAQVLGVGQPTVSRRIAELEDEVGDTLFLRRRRGVEPTALAIKLEKPAREMGRWAAELGRAADARRDDLDGLVRLAAPPGWAVDFLAPAMRDVVDRHPGIQMQLLANIAYVDVVGGGADLALRLKPPRENGLQELGRLIDVGGVYASAEYAKRLPAEPTLADIDFVTWAPPLEHLEPRSHLERMVPDFSPVLGSDSFVVQCRAVAAGVGAMIVASATASAHGLERLPIPLPRLEFPHYLITAASAWRIPRVRAVGHVLLDQLEAVAKRLDLTFVRADLG